MKIKNQQIVDEMVEMAKGAIAAMALDRGSTNVQQNEGRVYMVFHAIELLPYLSGTWGGLVLPYLFEYMTAKKMLARVTSDAVNFKIGSLIRYRVCMEIPGLAQLGRFYVKIENKQTVQNYATERKNHREFNNRLTAEMGLESLGVSNKVRTIQQKEPVAKRRKKIRAPNIW